MKLFTVFLLACGLAFSQNAQKQIMIADTDAPMTPTDSPGGGTYGSTQSVTLSDPTAALILYTTDGSTPACPGTGTLYTGAFNISVTTTLKAIGCNGITGGGVLTSVYTISAAGPVTVCSAFTGGSAVQTQTCNLSTVSGDRVIEICFSCKLNTPTFSSTTPSLTWTNQQNAELGSLTFFVVLADSVQTTTGTMACKLDLGSTQTFWGIGCIDLGKSTGVLDGTPATSAATCTGAGSAATPAVISATTANNNEPLIFASIFQSGTGYTAKTGYTLQIQDVTDTGGSAQTLFTNTAGSNSATVNTLPSAVRCGMILAAYTP